MNFNSLGLTDSLLRSINDSGYTTPTPIQQKAIPAVLEGRDVMAAAQTGTGKTAGFTLPLLQVLSNQNSRQSYRPRALVLTPTRELAAQVQESIETYGKHERLNSGVVFGGVNINPQMRMLKRGVDILVATPGRLLDLYQQKAVQFSEIEVLILDEADRMLDMGFIHDIKRIMALLPRQRQNLMFSATFSPDIRKLAKTIVHNPVEIDVAPRNSTVEAISQGMYRVEKPVKAQLLELILSQNAEQTLVFSRTKHGADNLVKRLKRSNISAEAIHGNKSQAQRTRVLRDFKNDRVQVLVATDIAARGIDIDQLAMVINFDMPHVPEDYVHRIGRTGRAGASGQAISLVSGEEVKQLRAIERLIKQSIKQLSYDESKLSHRAPANDNQNHYNSAPQRPNTNNRSPKNGFKRPGSNPSSARNKKQGGFNKSSKPQRAYAS
jgi:ATP-dependent RNA helicase RhlE